MKIKMKISLNKIIKNLRLVTFIIAGLLSMPSFAQNVSIMTFNADLFNAPSVFGLGFGPQCDGSDCRRRAGSIAEKVIAENPDVVLLQEVEASDAINIIRTRLRSEGYIVTNDKGSGLLTATKFPIVNRYFEEYREKHGTLGDGGDAWVDKGFLSTTLAINGQHVNVINTHTDSKNDCEDSYTRMHQIYQFTDYLNTRPSNTPVLFGGDFNMNVNKTGKIGVCNNNEYYQVVNEYGFNPAYRTTKTEFQLFKLISGMDAVHEILNTSLSTTTVSNNNSVLDYFMAEHHQGDLTFQNIRTLDLRYDIEVDTFCYEIGEIEYGNVTHTYTECYPRLLTSSEIYEIVKDGENTVRLITQTRFNAESDHFPVLLNFRVN
ncbi:hypothetical protein EYS14_04765 [Alteromonadaceae bacterium M269]|nr:hypothetical protein EYS14_04765 [Alteromonadaceae bacterium M269]